MKPAESRAYDAAVECAALCAIALHSVAGGPFQLHMREALREALHLRGAPHDNERKDDAPVARAVRDDAVARVRAICARDCTPIPEAGGEPEIGQHAERLLSEYLDLVVLHANGMCPVET